MCVRIELKICKNRRSTKSNQNSQSKTCNSSTDVAKLAKHPAVFSSDINENTHVAWGLPPQPKESQEEERDDKKNRKKWKMERNWRKQPTGKRERTDWKEIY